MTLEESMGTVVNMMLDNMRMGIYPALAMCYWCGFAPVRKLKVTIYAPRQSYHCPACERSYWIPVARKEE